MSQLELIWELENRRNQLDSYLRELNITNNSLELITLEKKLHSTKKKYMELREEFENSKVKIYKYSTLLKDYEYKFHQVEKDLYNGDISDLKRLNYLSDEKIKISSKIEETETKILTLMEYTDSLEIEVNKTKKDQNKILEDIENLRLYLNNTSKKLLGLINFEETQIESHIKEIDKVLLNRYFALRKAKGSGIAAVRQQVCSGCNMHIPTSQWEKLKNNDDIIYCESCGRILYYNIHE